MNWQAVVGEYQWPEWDDMAQYFFSFEVEEWFVLICTWENLNNRVIEHVYEKGQDIMDKINGSDSYNNIIIYNIF